MDPTLLKIELDIRDGCIDPQIFTMGIEWTVSTPDSTFNKSSDSKTLQFKQFPSGVRYIYISAKLLFRKLNDPMA